ncbi:MAG: hypothetical protein Q4D13_05405 [Erysipelotrichaceae bacterium]|nr:hypothetical protein [Erysipelotrichaceae bacterium]
MSETAYANKLEEILLQYTYYYGIRQSNDDKKKIYGYIYEIYNNKVGLKVTYDKLSLGPSHRGLCVVGNIAKADNVFIVPLDTKSKAYLYHYKYYPFNDKKTNFNKLAASLCDWGICLILMAIVYYLSYRLFAKGIVSAILAIVVMFIFHFFARNIFNFNSSAPMALLNYIAVNSPNKRKNAYVFLDMSDDNYVTLKAFLVKYKQQLSHAKKVLYLNNLAGGEHPVLAHGKETAMLNIAGAKEVLIEDNNMMPCFEVFPKLYILTGADINNKGDYVVLNKRSKNDNKMDVKRLKEIAETFLPKERETNNENTENN